MALEIAQTFTYKPGFPHTLWSWHSQDGKLKATNILGGTHIWLHKIWYGKVIPKVLKVQAKPKHRSTQWQIKVFKRTLCVTVHLLFHFLHSLTKRFRKRNCPDLILNACDFIIWIGAYSDISLRAIAHQQFKEVWAVGRFVVCIYIYQMLRDEPQCKPSSQTVFLGSYHKFPVVPNQRHTYLKFGAG